MYGSDGQVVAAQVIFANEIMKFRLFLKRMVHTYIYQREIKDSMSKVGDTGSKNKA
jgi:hypothetical protein